ncbi:hypothetical protein BDF22DRAFT_633316 [Syncephalis plumigaleata]|nr:hypothetical protein BDF22DRAFT_633316 [Syncephalis plumigaleata]
MTRDIGQSPGVGRGKRPYRAAYQQSSAMGGNRTASNTYNVNVDNEPTNLDLQFENTRTMDAIDERMGFHRFQEGAPRLGWLINMHPTIVQDKDTPSGRAGVDYYFLEEDGNTFKATIVYSPYFLIACKPGTESEVEDFLKKQYEDTIEHVEQVHKEDLKMPNHLRGLKRTFIKLSFRSVRELLTVRKIIMPAIRRNEKKTDVEIDALITTTDSLSSKLRDTTLSKRTATEILDNIVDIREYDIPYYIRVAIDNDIRVGLWYDVKANNGTITLIHRPDLVKRPEPVVLAFDIETTKLPLKFPDASIDSIMMISYMVDGQGFLITNRDIVSQDIDDFDYTPKPEFDGPFHIFNEPDEASLLRRFFEHIEELRPTVLATYNGDSFDWPFVEARAKANGIDMKQEIGFFRDEQDEYKSRYAIHMDCFRWVKRDSYLPVGSHGLKAVAKAKLGYNPDEIDPEDMTRFAAERPQTLAQYSVSDAVATYYLYMKYVHPFIFSLCNIIPSNGDEVLRKGSGTLCELLLMVEAYRANVIIPNKYQDPYEKLFDGHLLESETYVGGHVEALEAGVFRSDIPIQFKIVPSAAQQLIDQVDAAIRFTVEVENKKKMDDVINYNEIREEIIQKLADLRDKPERLEAPKIYHLDVAAMYPNIILTNRLQPDAIVNERVCATCDFNLPGKECDRRMNWLWRGQYFQADRNEYRMIKNQLSAEQFPGKRPSDPMLAYHQLSPTEQASILRKRIADYSRRVYTRTHATKVVEKEAIICQRENPFYVNTVLSFRDRRYEYKGLHKTWKKKYDTAKNAAEQDEASKMVIVYDSLQLAHKCILNSFYGYVMRKAARWYSMEMAGVVCNTGSSIIQMARQLVEQLGRPLELDTDGIWCTLPSTFPENFVLQLTNNRSIFFSYPCVMLNHLVHDQFTNRQYQELVDPERFIYKTREENSIFFEVDGPYHAMILPSSKEADKLLKKRYAVFNFDGSLAELKGFEVKRRGELKLIKIFQSQIFKVFLQGSTLTDCYAAVAGVADQWLDVLFSKGARLQDEELLDLISENRSMSKSLEEYGGQKSTSISTARRLAEFLGDQMVKDKGLACRFIISAQPYGDPVSERAVPVAIFSAETSVKKHFLRKWLKNNSLQEFQLREILDWQYYQERLGSVIQKLITIPAAMQRVPNPVPRVRHPDWLLKRLADRDDRYQQRRITDHFTVKTAPALTSNDNDGNSCMDIEDIGQATKQGNDNEWRGLKVATVRRKRPASPIDGELNDEDISPYTDYSRWLMHRKPKWRQQINERRHRRQLLKHLVPSIDQVGRLRVQHRELLSLLGHPWQILQMVETEQPGQIRVWAIVDKRLCDIRVHVPRRLYVNHRHQQWDNTDSDVTLYKITKRHMQLPRSHRAHHVYEIKLWETTYVENAAHFQELSNDPMVVGVYESKISSLDRALLDLGCIQTIVTDRLTTRSMSDVHYLKDGFSTEELITPPNTSTSNIYLGEDTLALLHPIYIYHSMTGARHCFGIFFTRQQQACIIIVDPAGDQQQLSAIQRMYTEHEQYNNNSSDNNDDDHSVLISNNIDYTFKVDYHRTESAGLKAIRQLLGDHLQQQQQYYQYRRTGANLVVIRSPWSESIWRTTIRGGLTDTPLLMMPSHQEENQFPALNWHRWCVRLMLDRYFELDIWLQERIALARYANVPIGNIDGDATQLLMDVFFARRLRANSHVLWWSSSLSSSSSSGSYNHPDLGREYDIDYRFELEDLAEPYINTPGSHRTVCVSLDLSELAANTLLESAHLLGTTDLIDNHHPNTASLLTTNSNSNMEMDNATTNTDDTSIQTSDENSVSSSAFALIKTMIRAFCQEYAETNNPFAALFVERVQRWMVGGQARLYDPLLHQLLHTMMGKVLSQLIVELKRLGSRVIFANFNRMIIVTTKTLVGNAYAYLNYVIQSINDKAPFRHLTLTPTIYWERLIWLDPANYGGILCKYDPTMENEQEETASELSMRWCLGEYLPSAIRPSFERLVSELVYQTYKANRTRIHSGDDNANSNNNSNSNSSNDKKDGDIAYREFVQRLIERKFTRHLLRLVPDIEKQAHTALLASNSDTPLRITDASLSDYTFPVQLGTWREQRHPALEFVLSICHVLALETEASHEVRVLRRNLLALLKIGEFSNESRFEDPCTSVRLTQVICNYCHTCSDIDLCRDPHPVIADNNSSSSNGDGTSDSVMIVWQCRSCQQPLDKSILEDQLIQLVERRVRAYQLQDLRCKRCRWIKENHLAPTCTNCAGSYELAGQPTRKTLVQQLRIFYRLANLQKLTRLADVISWYNGGSTT